ncbi:MAG: DUF2961 domain-containing protein [Eubacteriales bacterium]|nr:DUF2961 domain-containing protein [Eubacteriales bacterium]
MSTFFLHDDMAVLKKCKSRSISAENPTGEKGKGAMSESGVCSPCAEGLGIGGKGKGWKLSPCIFIEPGETSVICDIAGPGTIKSMWFTGCLGRDFIFRIYWDGYEYPSVETPLADFFGCGWYDPENKIPMEFAPLNSAVIAVCPSYGLNSYFTMPFARHCKMTIENRSDRRATLYYQINYELGDITPDSAYFHAHWKRTNPVPVSEEYILLDGVRGRGHYVGTMLNIGLNGPNLWFGEGEIKFYIDGDTEYPTICGTGTEDYFGGAWGWDIGGRYTKYSTLYLGVHFIHEPKGGEDIQPRFSMYRWHLRDPVIFDNDLRVTIHNLGWRRNGKRYLPRSDDYSSVAYWYQTLPASPFEPLPGRDEMEII